VKDRRLVEDLTTEELERILLVKRREARLARLRQMDRSQHVVGRDPLEPPKPRPKPPPLSTEHRQFRDHGTSGTYRSQEVDAERGSGGWDRLAGWLAAPVDISWHFVANRLLLIVEVAAVLGLIGIAISTWQEQQSINRDAAALVAPPTPTVPATPTPVPVVKAVVLPGGHTPPDASGFSQPAPIPPEAEALAQFVTPVPIPTPGPEHARRLVIPAIDVDHPVVEGDDWEALKLGVGHSPWSANPGEAGNCVLVAHNDIYGEIFWRLPEVELGDEVWVHTQDQVYRYVVQASRVVVPTDLEVLAPTEEPVLTLISSYPYLVDDQHIVVVAALVPQQDDLSEQK
jgi:sortase A